MKTRPSTIHGGAFLATLGVLLGGDAALGAEPGETVWVPLGDPPAWLELLVGEPLANGSACSRDLSCSTGLCMEAKCGKPDGALCESASECAAEECTHAICGRTLLVRTINLANPLSMYPKRMKAIAEEVHATWPFGTHPGIIGLQEVRTEMTNCQAGSYRDAVVNGAKCFQALLEERYSTPWSRKLGRHPSDPDSGVGAVAGNDWTLLAAKSFELDGGGFRCDDLPDLSTCYDPVRAATELYLRHRTLGLRLRFYDTHLWPGARRDGIRQKEVDNLIQIIRARVQDGELPPIVAGDFNAGRVYANSNGDTPLSTRKLEEHFWRPIDEIHNACGAPGWTGIDIVYVGRRSSFPGTVGGYSTAYRHVFDATQMTCFGERLSDHPAEGVVLYIHSDDTQPAETASDHLCSTFGERRSGEVCGD